MKGLLWYLVKRVLAVLIVVVLIASAVFAAFFLMGHPMTMIPRGGSQQLQEHIISDLKLNEPIPAQYVNFMIKTLSGEFFDSVSIWKGASTGNLIYHAVGTTLELFAAVLVPALLLGWALGRLVSGRRESKLRSRFARLISLGFASVPITSAALLLFYYYVRGPDWVPSLRSMATPWIASFPIAVGTYILMMKGKERHFDVSRSGSPDPTSDRPVPTTSITKLYVAWVMVIVLVAETVFGYYGLGLLTWEAIMNVDATVQMACIFLVAVTVAFTNFALDLVSPFVKSWLSKRNTTPKPEAATASEPESTGATMTGAGACKTLKLVAKDYAHRPLGIAALVIVLVFLVLAVFAPFLATVPNPDDLANYERPSLSEHILNPMSPSFDRSPRTGFIHPLGTDTSGRDVYSELLYGAGAPLILLAILVVATLAVGVVIWMIATCAARLPSSVGMIMGGFSSVVADFVIAFPIFLLYIAGWYPPGSDAASLYIQLAAIPLLVWACSFRVIRVKMPAIRRLRSQSSTAGMDLFALRSVMPKAACSILYITKFIVLFGFLTVLAAQFFVPFSDGFLSTSWGWLSEQGSRYSAALLGAWWLIIPQLVLAALLVGAVYKILDTMEQVMVRRFGTLA